MNEEEFHKLRFPIGEFVLPKKISAAIQTQHIHDIETFPERLQKEVSHLNDEQLDTAYRPNGWTIRQVIHHCADSHMNALIRFKLSLTENKPTIKPYMEHLWAELVDTKSMPIKPALNIIDGVHERWTILLKSLHPEDLQKSYIHPEYNKEYTLLEAILLYGWHCNHHLAHITELKKRKGWN